MVNTKIWATDKDSVDIGCKVVKWDEPGGLDFTKSGKFISYPGDITLLRQKITQLTVHWAATYRAKHMYTGLNARGLSVNFMIDDDCDANGFATIYQCLPISKLGYSQGRHTDGRSFNGLGPGIELSYQPNLWETDMYDPGDRKKWDVPEHKNKKAPIHGTQMSVHLPTDAQMKSLNHLILGFCRLFPNIPSKFPRDKMGNIPSTVIPNPMEYKGLCGHFHLRRDKIDPAGLDFESVENFVNQNLGRK